MKVIPRAGKNKVEKISQSEYKVHVTVAPEKGKANEAVVKMLASYFGVSKNSVSIVAGRTARMKIIDIPVQKEEL